MSNQETRAVRQQVGPWTIEAVYGAGQFPEEIRISTEDAKAREQGITQTLLRELKLQRPNEVGPAGNLIGARVMLGALEEIKAMEVGGKGSLTEDYYRKLSAAYDTALRLRKPAPVTYIANYLGKNVGTIRNHLTKARKLGLLSDDSK
ncbi:hypothetical protein ACFPFX_09180 [Streptomyces mauvecolor]|uniref:Uncharacterized protein n=1 Tax=Streptomyces mauvecolor TaxID=58345 RepID=A0ABV9UHI1_9ACTN